MSPLTLRRLLVGLALAALLLSPPSLALAGETTGSPSEDGKQAGEQSAAKKTRKQEREERRKYAIRPRTSKTFSKVREHLDAERWVEAEAALGKLRLPKLGAHERAQTHRLSTPWIWAIWKSTSARSAAGSASSTSACLRCSIATSFAPLP